MAIHKAGLHKGDRPRMHERHEAVRAVFAEWLALFKTSVFPWNTDDVIHWMGSYRRRKENVLKVEAALAHGCRCYFKRRGKGPCSKDAEWGHVVPRCRGGEDTVRNTQIECRAHNNQRRDMSIEEYMQSDLTTVKVSPLMQEVVDGR